MSNLTGHKIIFLDIDGVLNTENFIEAFFAILRHAKVERSMAKHLHKIVLRDDFGNHFDPMALRWLKYIIDNTGAKIVISSSWRHSGLEFMQNLWKSRGLVGEVIDITPSHLNMRSNNLPFDERLERGNEIKEWLDKNPTESYVIIDDDDDMLPEQNENFVQTDPMYGIMFPEADRAVKILNGVKQTPPHRL